MALMGSASLIAYSPAVMAAEVDEVDEEEDIQELEEVQVTGSRIQSPNVTSANPVTSITGDEMRQLGLVNVADVMTQLVPQNLSTYMPTMTGDDQAGYGGGGMDRLDRGSFFIGQTIANLRGLDPTFGTRTLTLVDGRRVVSTSNQADVVDMNIIPSNLLQRVDVVTGGASATYGSGAMAGVVNMVLNNRMTGVSLDMDYAINEAGDGGSPHVSLSGGMPLFGGRGHMLLSAEWQKSNAIRNCAEARSWCAESRTMFTNNTGSGSDPSGLASPLPGFEGLPARFEMANVRLSQFSPNGVIYHNNSSLTTGIRFSDDGTDYEEYAYGFRGGTGSNVLNGDGPLATFNQTMRPSNERKVFFSNFEYNVNERTTAYLQANFSQTEGLNQNQWTRGNYCVRFDAQGVAGTNAPAQAVLVFGSSGGEVNGVTYNRTRDSRFGSITSPQVNAAFAAFLGLPGANGTNTYPTSYLSGNGYGINGVPETPRRGMSWPFWVPVELSPNPPNFDFGGNAIGTWVKFKYTEANWQPGGTFYTAEFPTGEFWLLDEITLTNAFDVGTPTILPTLGRNSYAFLNDLSPEALNQVQSAFSNSIGTGAGAGLTTLYGETPCNGFTALRKVWNPQVQQWTSNESETLRLVGGIKGRFGGDWRWDAYFQYGETKSSSYQSNVATNLRLAWALDAVIDDRIDSPTYGQPVCRTTRDGTPVLDRQGRPLSNPESLAALAAGCVPLNIFGSDYSSDPEAAARQQAALDYAFVDTSSSGKNSLATLALNTNGTLWQGWAGPLTGAFGFELREDKVNNAGSLGDYDLRSDLARTWADAYGGKTRTTEGFTELNMPLVSAVEGANLVSINFGARYSSYHNKGGAGTTGESATQNVFNWKTQLVYEPFDFVRFRLSRSRDLRAATYRDLFTYQPGIPDEFTIQNPWRERTATSSENQNELYGQVRVGNSQLKPEKSDTLTVGMVLSPGGWAQGMRVSVDYYDIRVKDGINTPFNSQNPVRACWEGSGNKEAVYAEGEIIEEGINGLFDESLEACRELAFAELTDSMGNPIPGTRNLEDIVSYNSARPRNSLPYGRKGVDVSLSYNFPLSRAFESLPGTMSFSIRGQRAIESSGVQQTSTSPLFPFSLNTDPCGAKFELADPNNPTNADGSRTILNRYQCVDMVGQIRSSVFVPGVQASPKWSGNITSTYMLRDLTVSLSARYIGGAKYDNQWCDTSVDCPYYQDEQGRYLNGSVDNNRVDPYFNFSLNGSYNLNVANMKQFQVFGSINNLFDKSPPFTGGGISGASSQYHDTMGRAYRMGVRMKF
jgi:outer membrane receptor protein involved in Fe transport